MRRDRNIYTSLAAVLLALLLVTTGLASADENPHQAPVTLLEARQSLEESLKYSPGFIGIAHLQESGEIVVFLEGDLYVATTPAAVAGFPVRTEVTDTVYALSAQVAEPAPSLLAGTARQGKVRPLVGGTSVGALNYHTGTLGMVTYDGRILSNAHVIAMHYAESLPVGTPIIQPGGLDDGVAEDRVGELWDYAELKFDGSPNYIDAAVGLVDSGVATQAGWLFSETGNYQVSGATSVSVGDTVRKSGRTTGTTEGEVAYTNLSGWVHYNAPGDPVQRAYFIDQLVIEQPFADGGDSGSVVDKDGAFVGLVFADNDQYAMACKAEHIIEDLKIVVDPPPILLQPMNGAVVHGHSVFFSWDSVGGADRYWLSVNTSPGFGEATRFFYGDVGNYTAGTLSGFPDNGTTYYWRVCAGNNSGWGPWSSTWQFTNGIACSVSTPTTPSGSTSGHTGTSYTYSTGGSTCAAGHSVQYRFDWGDGTFSSWSSSNSASKSWASTGKYEVRAQARCATDNTVESSWSKALSVTMRATPTITTTAATEVEAEAASLNMTYSPGCYESVEVRFAYKNSADSTWTVTAWVSKSADGSYSESLIGLDSDTEYDFRAELRYNTTVLQGDVLQFTTLRAPPTVSTNAASHVDTDSATLHMDYTLGDYDEVDVRFGYKKHVDSEWIWTSWESQSAGGSHAEPLTGLDSNTEYDFRAELRYNATVVQGDVLQFTTLRVPPDVSTADATDVGSDTATVNMDYTLGDYDEVEVRFAYRKSIDSTWTVTSWVPKSAGGSHSASLTGLDSDTEYDFRAELKYNSTVLQGDVLQFTTLPNLPTVRTSFASNTSSDSATLHMTYTVGDYPPVDVRFAYRVHDTGPWTYSTWTEKHDAGSHSEELSDLESNTLYDFMAELRYDTTEVIQGDMLQFTTGDLVLHLQAGWNMVSVPVTLDPERNSSEEVFPGVAAIYEWNASDRSYMTPTVINSFRGYWVAVVEDVSIAIAGEPSYHWDEELLYQGWNMVGSTYEESIDLADLEDTPHGSVDREAVYYWNPEANSYQTVSTIERGKGYWMATDADCLLILGTPPP